MQTATKTRRRMIVLYTNTVTSQRKVVIWEEELRGSEWVDISMNDNSTHTFRFPLVMDISHNGDLHRYPYYGNDKNISTNNYWQAVGFVSPHS